MIDKKLQILVVMGGMSTEREVSLRSGEAIYNALISRGYNAEKFILDSGNVSEIFKKSPDYVFLALHGKWGEDGTIQGMLELAGIPYTGSGVACSAVSINKILTKKMLKFHGIKTPEFISVSRYDVIKSETLAKRVVAEIGLPVVVKASCQGSSVGVKIVQRADELPSVIDELLVYDGELLFEEYMQGQEMTVPVIYDNGEIRVFPIIEITSENSFYDFESKYTAGMSHHIIPARISESVADEVKRLTVETYKALDCSGIVRVDFMLDVNNVPNVIEVNTLPGMTATSLVPDAARAVGMEFEDIVEKILMSADDKSKLRIGNSDDK